MPLEDYEETVLKRCIRCSYCKHVPYLPLARIDRCFRTICPSIEKFKFHSWSAGGRIITAYSLLLKRIPYSPKVVDIVYQCHMCGACDISCKIQLDLEVYETLLELRSKCVKDNQYPKVLDNTISSLRKENNMLQKSKSERGKWIGKLDVKRLPKEKANVVLHAGCAFSFRRELWPTIQMAVELIKEANIDLGIFGENEVCCGGRAYELGFQEDFIRCMVQNVNAWRNVGAKTIVTPCSQCYATFKSWYSRFGHREFEILHVIEYVERLLKEGKIRLRKEIPIRATYHDPCHLGRLSEPYLYSSPGKPYITAPKRVLGAMLAHDPPKPWRKGAGGVYDPPRETLKRIPGLKFVEMHRIKEYAWCCGGGGGVRETYPEFATWTAKQRVMEAKAVGAEAIVTACGWCEKNLGEAIEEIGDGKMVVYDVVELVRKSVGV